MRSARRGSAPTTRSRSRVWRSLDLICSGRGSSTTSPAVRTVAQGVTASGVTLFVPMSLVAGSSNNIYAIDNDNGYIVWQRHFDAAVPAATPACPGGITSAATRIVRLDASAAPAAPGFGGRGGAVGYRSLLGEPGEGVPVEGRAGGPQRGGDSFGVAPPAGARGAAPGAGTARGAAPGAPRPGREAGRPSSAFPARHEWRRRVVRSAFSSGHPAWAMWCPATACCTSSAFRRARTCSAPHPSCRPTRSGPRPSRWTPRCTPRRRGTAAARRTPCGPSIPDSEAKPVVSWKTNGGGVVGAVAFTFDGTLIAAIGPGQTTGGGKANAIVALDPKTLQLKDWFSQPTAEFVTGPTILRYKDRDIIAAATKDGRIVLLDAASLGGSDHATPLHVSKALLGAGGTVSGDALAAWQGAASWVLLPVRGTLAAGNVRHERCDCGRRGRRAEVERRRGRALAGTRMGLSRPLRRRAPRSSSTAWCSRWRPVHRRRRLDAGLPLFSTHTTAQLASGCGPAARR